MRVVGQDDIGARLPGDVAKTSCRVRVRFKPEPVRPVGSYVERSVSKPVEIRTAPLCCNMRLAAVLDRNNGGDGAERVTGGQVQSESCIAESQALTVGRDHVSFRLRPGASIAVQQIPVGGGHNDMRPETILQEFGASRVINVAVTDDHVFNLLWI